MGAYNKGIDEVDRVLINLAQNYKPVTARPFLELAVQLNMTENAVIERLKLLDNAGIVSRYGAVFNHKRAGASTLVAMSVPESDVASVVECINCFDEVNHNYLREHEFNIWFVVTAMNQKEVDEVIFILQESYSYPLMDLPMEKSFFIDLGFSI